MNFFLRALKFNLVLFFSLCLYGCSDKTQPQIKQPAVKQTQQKDVKPGASVKLISPSILTIDPNKQTSTEILFETTESSGEFIVELFAPTGLSLLNTPTQQTINLVSPGNIKIPISLLAVTNGRYYLKMHILMKKGDSIAVRNLAVIIQVGPEPEKAVQLKKTSGENVISLPAQETISTQ